MWFESVNVITRQSLLHTLEYLQSGGIFNEMASKAQRVNVRSGWSWKCLVMLRPTHRDGVQLRIRVRGYLSSDSTKGNEYWFLWATEMQEQRLHLPRYCSTSFSSCVKGCNMVPVSYSVGVGIRGMTVLCHYLLFFIVEPASRKQEIAQLPVFPSESSSR